MYISLEQNGTKSAKDGLDITQREETQKEDQEMSNPLPLMSKGEKKKEGFLKGKQRKYVAINAKGVDCWKCCH